MGIDLNLRLGSLEVHVVCGAFCLGGGSWVRELWYCGFCGVGLGPFSQNVSSGDLGVGVSEGVGCVRDSAMVLKGSRLDDADGNPVLLVRQRRGGGQLADRIERRARLAAA